MEVATTERATSWSWRIGFALILVVSIAFAYLVPEVQRRYAESNAKELLGRQIADIQAGKSTKIHVGMCEMSVFVDARAQLAEAHDYDLELVYAGGVDGFFQQIQGLSGVRSLMLYKTDVSDAGLSFVASLPDLTRLRITRAPISDAGLENLQGGPKLASLKINLQRDIPAEVVERLNERNPQCKISVVNEAL